MYDLKNIKLVIWDLDETFWKGTLSEGKIEVPPEHIQLIKRLTDAGIMNSICSKNDYKKVQDKLKELKIWDYFVFASIDWNPKGVRIQQLISDMHLRPQNVLFIDDNRSNLEEARFLLPDLMTMLPDKIPTLLRDTFNCKRVDMGHKRLQQYQLLEEKRQQKEKFNSNEQFLYSCNIRVYWGDDCLEKIDRIHDLVWRSNQLNFTKIRSTKEELIEIISTKEYKCGYISVKDKFGDYGIIGFFALKNNKLIHFCFSCRTLGMGIEQYVYIKLGRPKLKIKGEVVSNLELDKIPGWINQEGKGIKGKGLCVKSVAVPHSVLIKGPCDLFQILPYIADKSIIDTEFTYVNSSGVTIESTGHTTHIVEALHLSTIEKQRVLREVPFADVGIYNDNIYKKNYKLAIISILQDANLGVYRRKETGEKIAFLEGYHPITEKKNWNAYINGQYNTASFHFTRECLETFSEKYEFVGINTPEQIVKNLEYIKEHLPEDCVLAVMLGGELEYKKNTIPAYKNRHLVHREINDAIREKADEIGIKLIDVNKYLVDQSCFYDHFNHYIKPIYYRLAGDIVSLIDEQTGISLQKTSKLKMLQVRMKESFAPIYYKIRKYGRR
ncbi:MAG: HAD-IIIC family phosphatase [Blautia sp.]|uniref:HAD-IIIC family phosphatase n=1 Tax=Blautia sp. TaxID=1955243 RepID=UPI00258804F5|nr:HAD-IIIC family phosphatase [Blautia sp.]MCI7289263.1 HAD-IIIC family phosphatase [Blautia sp.]